MTRRTNARVAGFTLLLHTVLGVATMVVIDIYLYVRFKKTRWL